MKNALVTECMDKMKVAVVIPFYKTTLSTYEKIAITQCKNILGNYPIIVIKPVNLDLPTEIKMNEGFKVVEFDKKYFSGIAGYNSLMLSTDFYSAFNEFKYILIHQLDAFVFKDELSYWCDQNFDYIGAPWIRKNATTNFLKSAFLTIQQKASTSFNLKKRGLPNKYQFEGKVGNGGLSLRKVDTLTRLSINMKSKIDEYLAQNTHHYNEDAFWSIEVNRNNTKIKIPDWRVGLRFAFENNLENCLQYNNNILPFGCHAWDKNINFWRPVFEDLGYLI